jgi:hypothetical protein
MGILSRRTAATQAGLDFDAEVKSGVLPKKSEARNSKSETNSNSQ